MNINELIKKLQQYPSDLPVVCTWELLFIELKDESFTVRTDENGIMTFLEVDVNDY